MKIVDGEPSLFTIWLFLLVIMIVNLLYWAWPSLVKWWHDIHAIPGVV